VWTNIHGLLSLYKLRAAVVAPVVVAVIAGAAVALLAPSDLSDNSRHEEWKDVFGTSGQVIATLLVALGVEAHVPFSRSGALAIRLAAAASGLVLAFGGLAALAGLSPSLPGCAYPWLMGITVGATVGGFAAVTILGVSVAWGTLATLDREAVKRLAELGDHSAVEALMRDAGS
jgi:hypothetical protein